MRGKPWFGRLVIFALVACPARASWADSASIRDAEDAYVEGDYRKAIAIARRLIGPEDAARAWSVIVPAHCSLGELEAARAGFPRVADSRKKSVAALCRKHGLSL